MCFVLQNTPPPINGLTGVQITGTGGQISFNTPTIPLTTTAASGMYITATGNFTGSGNGSISGYSNQNIYSISATNGTSTATLQTAIGWDSSSSPGSQIGPNPITTTAGLTNGLSFTQNASSWMNGPTVMAVGSYGLGYGGLDAQNGSSIGQAPGILNSVAIAINPGSTGYGASTSNGVGIYTNGLAPWGSQIATTLSMTGTFTVTITYSDTTVGFSMTNGTNTYSHNFTGYNIASIVGGNTAYAGFTAGTYSHVGNVAINSWTMSSP